MLPLVGFANYIYNNNNNKRDEHQQEKVLKVAARGGQGTALQRLLQLLYMYPLEIHNSSGKDGQVPNEENEWNSPTQGDEDALTTDDPPTHDCERPYSIALMHTLINKED